MQRQLARVVVASAILSAGCNDEKKTVPMTEPVQTTQKTKTVHPVLFFGFGAEVFALLAVGLALAEDLDLVGCTVLVF